MKLSAAPFGLLASLIPLTMAPNPAAAQSVGDIYWGVFGAAQFPLDNEIEGGDVDFDPGFNVGGQLGYIFGSVRAEAEFEYGEAQVAEFDDSHSIDSTLTTIRGTGSLYFDFIGFNQSNILPYVGAGFGVASLRLNDDIDDGDVGMTAHGEIGVSFAAAANFDVVFAYRFEWFDTNVGGVDDNVQVNQVRAGIRFFTGPGCC